MHELHETARELVADNRGILAADESSGTIAKRFDTIGLESTEENRRAYRDLLFTTPGLEESVSGVILYDETLRQASADGTPFAELLASRGIVPGIKVDTGAKDLAGAPGEQVTEGLDGLRERLEEYRGLGARFAKWRAVITIGDGIPTAYCIQVNAHALARYAALCQEQGLVPIVEPEVLMDGDNDIETCYRATKRTLHKVFDELYHQRVDLEAILLKPNMVISGKGSPTQASAAEVAEWTLRCFHETVPAAVPGIVFLSGGQGDEQASENLNALNSLSGPYGGQQPWALSFSYGRALQAPALKAWGGKPENVEAGQSFLALRARCNSAAVAGRYSAAMEELSRSS
jgi:fructose-bisphosphate aldolase, class I